MSSERRLIRPYVGLEPFQDVIDSLVMTLGPTVVQPGSKARVEIGSYLSDPPAVRLPADSTVDLDTLRSDTARALDELGFDPSAVEFVAIVSSPYLRLSTVVHQKKLSEEWLPERISLRPTGVSVPTFSSPGGGCDVEVCFVLAAPQAVKPLRPSRRGTWLGRGDFGLRTDLGDVGFTPIPLTADLRDQKGLSKNTVRFVEVDVEALFASDPSEPVRLYVDKHLLLTAKANETGAGSLAFQKQIFLDAVQAIVVELHRASRLEQENFSSVRDSVLGRILSSVGGVAAGDTSDEASTRGNATFQTLVDHPDVFIANVEAMIAPAADFERSILGGVDD